MEGSTKLVWTQCYGCILSEAGRLSALPTTSRCENLLAASLGETRSPAWASRRRSFPRATFLTASMWCAVCSGAPGLIAIAVSAQSRRCGSIDGNTMPPEGREEKRLTRLDLALLRFRPNIRRNCAIDVRPPDRTRIKVGGVVPCRLSVKRHVVLGPLNVEAFRLRVSHGPDLRCHFGS